MNHERTSCACLRRSPTGVQPRSDHAFRHGASYRVWTTPMTPLCVFPWINVCFPLDKRVFSLGYPERIDEFPMITGLNFDDESHLFLHRVSRPRLAHNHHQDQTRTASAARDQHKTGTKVLGRTHLLVERLRGHHTPFRDSKQVRDWSGSATAGGGWH